MITSQVKPCLLVAEIGINHNGDLEIAKALITKAKEAGFDVVKFQKRTIDLVYDKEELDAPRESPWGTTNREQKEGLEFGKEQYDEIDSFCRVTGIQWTASPWDTKSVDFLVSNYKLPYIKIASALVTHKSVLEACALSKLPIFMSVGGCSKFMIHKALSHIEVWGGKVGMLYHTCSSYPSPINELNLRAITTLKEEFPDIPIGYSGHEAGVAPSVMAAVLGAESIERHVTLRRTMYGSDQAASLEYEGMRRLVRDIRAWELAAGTGIVGIRPSEHAVMKKLRKVNDL